MASFSEWDESIRAMTDRTLEDVKKALWVLRGRWPLFEKEYRSDMVFLSGAIREEEAVRAVEASKMLAAGRSREENNG